MPRRTPRRTLVEILHIAIGLGATAAIVAASAWAYPLARTEIRLTGLACAVVVLLLGFRPVRRAWREDHGRTNERTPND